VNGSVYNECSSTLWLNESKYFNLILSVPQCFDLTHGVDFDVYEPVPNICNLLLRRVRDVLIKLKSVNFYDHNSVI
jgi:hypothetical protein